MSRRYWVSVSVGLSVAALIAAISLSPANAQSSRQPIPANELRRIEAEYGRFTYVPRFAPRGFIFTSWRIEPAQFGYLMEQLQLTFGRGGTRLVWTVSDRRDKNDYADCSRRPYFSFKRMINGRVVYYARGNHGDSAWTCLRHVGIDLWVENNRGKPSALMAMRMVAGGYRP